MSVYTYRYYEVKTAIVHDSLNKMDDFNNKYVNNPHDKVEDGYTVKIWSTDGPKYRIWSEKDQEWKIEEDCRHEWVLLRWYTKPDYGYSPNKYDVVVGEINEKPYDQYTKKRKPTAKIGEKLCENVCYCDNGGIIRDEYISRGYGLHETFADRGYATDMSKELKDILDFENEYTWGHTHVYISEWEAVYGKLLESFKKKLEDTYKEDRLSIIEKKIDILEKKMKDPNYKEPVKRKKKNDDEDYEETVEEKLKYLWEEDFWDILAIRGEINRAYNLIDEPFGWTAANDIRITYFLA